MNAVPAHAGGSGRHDLYRFIHKGLRAALFDTLRRLGAADADDPDALHAVLAQGERLLALLAAHMKHENDFVHTAIEARCPGAAQGTAGEHRAHLQAIEALRAEFAALAGARGDARTAQAERLYRHFAGFVVEQLQHMALEESHNNAALWALYSDAELAALHDRLLASIEPAMRVQALEWMADALAPGELVGVLADLRAKAPPEAFGTVVFRLRERLDRRRWMQVAHGLGLPPVPAFDA